MSPSQVRWLLKGHTNLLDGLTRRERRQLCKRVSKGFNAPVEQLGQYELEMCIALAK